MPVTNSNLYGRLFRYRAREARSPLEDFLSEALADLLGRMPVDGLADLLGAIMGAGDVWTEVVKSQRLEWTTQVACDGGFADIVLSIEGRPAMVIENKLHSGIRSHGENGRDNQLTTYGRWLARVRNDQLPSALVLLTQGTPPPADFLGNGHYGVQRRAVFTWARLARWLMRRAFPVGGSAWEVLSRDLVAFLGENGMTNDTITGSDVAAAHLFVPSWSRWENTFAELWNATSDLHEGVLSRKVSRLELNREGGMLWQWSFAAAPMPHSSWIAFGLRFPDISGWYGEIELPKHAHFLLIVGSENGKLPVESVERLPDGWSVHDAELITARSLNDFSGDSDGLMEGLAAWAREEMTAALSLLRVMAG